MNWASLGQATVWAVLFGMAVWLYWRAVRWCADALYISDMRAQERVSQRTLLEVADYLENLHNRKHEQLSEWDDERSGEPDREWEGPFMLDAPHHPKDAA